MEHQRVDRANSNRMSAMRDKGISPRATHTINCLQPRAGADFVQRYKESGSSALIFLYHPGGIFI
jgi:hypothetical protein